MKNEPFNAGLDDCQALTSRKIKVYFQIPSGYLELRKPLSIPGKTVI
jgi:hypothetical protein